MLTDLDYLLTPIERGEFLSSYWESRPLFINRDNPEYYSRLFNESDVEFCMYSASALHANSTELISSSSNEVSRREANRDVAQLQDEFEHGTTIRVKAAHRHSKKLWELCKELEQTFSFPVSTNLYCSPRCSRALPRHYDRHDVFVLQIAGSKQWKVYDPAIQLPLEYVPPVRYESGEIDKQARIERDFRTIGQHVDGAAREIELTAGDLLYLPRGFIHEVCTSDSFSVHLTVGVQALTLLDLAALALANRARDDIRFRKSLPVGFANRLSCSAIDTSEYRAALMTLLDGACIEDALCDLAKGFVGSRKSIGTGSLTRVDQGDVAVTSHSTVERRAGIVACIRVEAGQSILHFSHKTLAMPLEVMEALEFIVGSSRFPVHSIPGELSERSKVLLVNQLLRVGFLSVIDF